MEGPSSGLRNEEQNLKTELTNMLQAVVLPECPALEQCIHKAPRVFRESNPQVYTPVIVSIGPFHKENSALKPMEELKLQYLKAFLGRTTLCVDDFVVKLEELENKIRSCYAEPINYGSNDFLKMILIDAGFIIEHFLRFYEGNWFQTDPLLSENRWLAHNDLLRDFILLENQLPYFVLEDIYNLTGMNLQFGSFLEITFRYFRFMNVRKINFRTVYPKHFLDLLRIFQLPPIRSTSDLEALKESHHVNHHYSASQLLDAGLKFTVHPTGYSELEYREGELLMAPIYVSEFLVTFYWNTVAYESCHEELHSIISQYIRMVEFLIPTLKDVNILRDKKIVANWVGDNDAVLKLFTNLGSCISKPHFHSMNFSICKSLNDFYENPCNQYKATLRRDYFNTPWKITSTTAATVLLLLTLIQAVYVSFATSPKKSFLSTSPSTSDVDVHLCKEFR
ncbi:hypothetical protein Fmac_016187 [Flemingia macrophylla]|uniref:Uncharacterized protein n=1 Tax=Flemingia macrophylla TaxID=520843 RepID=A0ABD1MGN9_9FABA